MTDEKKHEPITLTEYVYAPMGLTNEQGKAVAPLTQYLAEQAKNVAWHLDNPNAPADPFAPDPPEPEPYAPEPGLPEFLEARITEDENSLTEPARQAETESKRRILAIHCRQGTSGGAYSHFYECCEGCGWGEMDPHTEHVNDCPTLRALALPYAYHPDCRPEWLV